MQTHAQNVESYYVSQELVGSVAIAHIQVEYAVRKNP